MVECKKSLGSTQAVVEAVAGSEAAAGSGSEAAAVVEVVVQIGQFDCWRAVPTKTVLSALTSFPFGWSIVDLQ